MTDEQIKSINSNLAASVLRLGNECRALAEEIARLKAEVERLHETGDAMAEWLNEQGNYGSLTDKWPKPFQNPLP